MKKVRLLALICMTFISLSSFAQMGGMGGSMGGSMGGRSGGSRGGMGGGQGMPQQPQKRSLDINFIGSAGFFTIDNEELLKKLKIKKDKQAKEEAVLAAVEQFTTSSEELIPIYRTDFDILEFAKEDVEEVMGDMIAIREIMTAVNKSMMVVRPKLVEIHKVLNGNMSEILDEKEMEKWAKFYKSICKENSFDPDARPRGMRPEGEEDEDGERPERPEGGRPPME